MNRHKDDEESLLDMDNIDKRKKVLIVFHDSDFSGGTRALVDLLDSWLEDSDKEFYCLMPRFDGQAIDYLKDKNVKIIKCRYWQAVRYGNENVIKCLKLYLKFFASYFIASAIAFTKIKKLNIDIVYTNTSSVYVGAVISKIIDKPHIWHVREYVGKDRAVVTLLPVKWHYNYLNKNADAVINISQTACDYYRNFLNKNKVVRIYDDVTKYKTTIMPWNNVKNNLLFVGNIIEGKGQLIAIKAMRILMDRKIHCTLSVVGPIIDETYYSSILRYVSENELTDVIDFPGKINNINEQRGKYGIAIIASTNEPFGRVTVEGMQAGQVVIGADSGCTQEIITDGENGFLFGPGDEGELANLIEKVILEDEEIITILRNNAIVDAEKYTQGRCAIEVEKIMEKLL